MKCQVSDREGIVEESLTYRAYSNLKRTLTSVYEKLSDIHVAIFKTISVLVHVICFSSTGNGGDGHSWRMAN